MRTPLPTFQRRKAIPVQRKVLLMSLIPRKEEAMIVMQLFVLMHNTALLVNYHLSSNLTPWKTICISPSQKFFENNRKLQKLIQNPLRITELVSLSKKSSSVLTVLYWTRAWCVAWKGDVTSELRNKNGFLLRTAQCQQNSKDLGDRNQKRTEDLNWKDKLHDN